MITTFFIGMAIAVAFILLWYIAYLKSGNSSILDIGWVLTVSVVHGFYLLSLMCSRLALAYFFIMLFWSLRQAYSLHIRLQKIGKDARYTDIEQRWGSMIKVKYFGLFTFEAVATSFITLPFLFIVQHNYSFSVYSWIMIVLLALSVCGEWLADYQKNTFFQSHDISEVCESGLWHYSRHPNYFFQFLIWVFSALLALGSALSFISLVSPVIIYVLLNYFSGVPLAERQSLKNKGEAFEHYQKTTSVFFPWVKKDL